MVAAAAVVVVVAGLREAQGLLAPFLLAAFLALLCTPPLQWLQERKLPLPVALSLVLVMVAAVLFWLVSTVSQSIDQFVNNLQRPGGYAETLHQKLESVILWLQQHQVPLPSLAQAQAMTSQKGLELLGSMLLSFGTAISNVLLVLIILVFMLLEASSFPRKLQAISRDNPELERHLHQVNRAVRRYVSLKTTLSLLTGALVAAWLWFLGVSYPLLWGTVAFLLNFVPNIGSILAAVPPVLLALLEQGWGSALYVVLGYGLINAAVGYGLEPRLMGRELGLSPLVVFLSLVFWGWVLGPVGMLLSVPLTMIVKIYLEAFPQTRWIAVLLGPDPKG